MTDHNDNLFGRGDVSRRSNDMVQKRVAASLVQYFRFA
jgi:hypothetical protein